MFSNRDKGSLGEMAAVNYLTQNGYMILHKNYSTKYGEIDIIAKDGDCIAFVEVKTRKDNNMGSPSEAVTRGKQHRIAQMALLYRAQKKLHNYNMRFDVVEVIINKDEVKYLRLIKDAFQIDYFI